jgi:hypothetical protein
MISFSTSVARIPYGSQHCDNLSRANSEAWSRLAGKDDKYSARQYVYVAG